MEWTSWKPEIMSKRWSCTCVCSGNRCFDRKCFYNHRRSLSFASKDKLNHTKLNLTWICLVKWKILKFESSFRGRSLVNDRNLVSAPNFGRKYQYRYRSQNFFFRNRNFFFQFFFFLYFFMYFCFLGEYKV